MPFSNIPWIAAGSRPDYVRKGALELQVTAPFPAYEDELRAKFFGFK